MSQGYQSIGNQSAEAQPKAVTSQVVTVTGKACLWFAWAPFDYSGPEGESGVAYLPPSLDVTGLSQVVVSASGNWRHHDSDERASGPEGLNDPRGLENPAYKSNTYNSANINPLTANLNRLVGLFEIGGVAPTAPVDQLSIGAGDTLIVPAGATRLFLGMHDGREWTNNSGNVVVTLDLSFVKQS